jgi:peptide/nickel transport system ATP-binding protein
MSVFTKSIDQAVVSPALLRVENLSVDFRTRYGTVAAVKDVSFSLQKGQTLGIVGESGSGKSVTSYAVMRILDRAGLITGGSAQFAGIRLDQAPEKVMNELRGREISMIFQNPRAALNPIRPVGLQIADVLIEHAQATREDAMKKAIAALEAVRIRDPQERAKSYPFELSGGMCQRVLIAMALACKPQLLIADEPTTGLDVTTQRAVMDLIQDLTRSKSMASILITHDLGLAGEYCDRIIVMEKGKVVETGTPEALFLSPQHPYTQRLVRATPHHAQTIADLLPPAIPASIVSELKAAQTLDSENVSVEALAPDCAAQGPLLDVIGLKKVFPKPQSFKQWLTKETAQPYVAVDEISFQVFKGETVGLVGESGCGKSTTSSMITRLLDPSAGSIWFKGKDISLIKPHLFAQSALRGKLQMVFQDPTDSLNPRSTAMESIADPIVRLLGLRDRQQVEQRVRDLARRVGLEAELLSRLPHQLSGGQKARVGIARALASEPELLILDEPTAALDVSVQAVVLNLLADLQKEMGMAYLFVSHDLEVVRLLCDRVLVMQKGKIVESGPTRQVFQSAQHEYTQTLLAAAPRFIQPEMA